MSFTNNNLSKLRTDIRQGNITKPKPKPNPGPTNGSPMGINSKFGMAIGGVAGIGGLGYGAHKMLEPDHEKIGEFGHHFEKSFSNLTGVHEDSGGFSVAASDAPAPYVGPRPSGILKDKKINTKFKNSLHRTNI